LKFLLPTRGRRGDRRRPGYPANQRASKGHTLQVLVRDNNVDQALKVLKRRLQREGLFRELKRRRAYEKPSERRARKASEAVRRARKQARKQMQRDGLLPAPKAAQRRQS
jgi:small subunit ribosomal protein S21